MSNFTSYADMKDQFDELVEEGGIDKTDIPAMAEAWNDFTDQEGLPALMYHHCPAHDDDFSSVTDAAETFAYIMEAEGYSFVNGEFVTKWENGAPTVKFNLGVDNFEDLLELLSDSEFSGPNYKRTDYSVLTHVVFGNNAEKVAELVKHLG